MFALITAAAITVLYALVGIACIAEFHRRQTEKNVRTVCLSKVVLWVGVICGGLFLAMSWLSGLQDGSIGVAICFGAFTLLGVTLMMAWKNCYIVYDDKGFEQHNILGMQRSFTYAQLTAYCLSDGTNADIKLYACGKTIAVDLTMGVGGPQFFAEARKGYARCNHGKVLPNVWEEKRKRAKKTGKSNFSAHVHNPGEFLAIFIILVIFMVGMSIFCLVMALEPIEQADCEQMCVTFSSWEVEGDTLVLHVDGVEESFKIGDYEGYMSGFDQLTQKCDGKTQFTAWTEYYEPDDEAPCYVIRELSADGEIYRTFADSTKAQIDGVRPVLYMFGGMDVILLLMAWLTYKIGCNPSKYPKWLVYAFFKKNAISF